MKEILLYQDEPLNLDLNTIVNNLSNICSFLRFKVGPSKSVIETPFLKRPESYQSLSDSIKKETENIFNAYIFSGKQYHNNYFFESYQNKVIISFFGWDSLTKLSMHNGVVFFIADLLALYIDNTYRHDETTGCIYDFGWHKPGIDLEMRKASICKKCQARLSKRKFGKDDSEIYNDLNKILRELRNASQKDQDIVLYWGPVSSDEPQETIGDKKKIFSKKYDVFLAHNSVDKPNVEIICEELKRRGLNPWLDKEQIPPGRMFQDYIQEAIKNISSVAIIIGNNGLGKWQYLELKSFISQCIDRNIPVIPVLLPGVDKLPDNLIFLREFAWVNFINDISETEAYDNLEWGITGRRPNQ